MKIIILDYITGKTYISEIEEKDILDKDNNYCFTTLCKNKHWNFIESECAWMEIKDFNLTYLSC